MSFPRSNVKAGYFICITLPVSLVMILVNKMSDGLADTSHHNICCPESYVPEFVFPQKVIFLYHMSGGEGV